MDRGKQNYWRYLKPWLGTIVLLPAAVYYSLNKGQFTFIDYLNLLIHEGGHGVFSIFGKFIYTLGGSLMQIIIPSIFIIYYWIRKRNSAHKYFLYGWGRI